MTSAEFVDALERDPEFQRRARVREAESVRYATLFRENARLILDDLRATGLRIESNADLMNTAEPYPEVIPVLRRHLPRPYMPGVRETIARALTV